MERYTLYRKVRDQAAHIRQLVVGITRPVEMLDNTQNAGLVKVALWFTDHSNDPARFSPTEHIVAADEVDTFVTASLELHENGRGAPVQYITTQPLQPSGPYWWSVPGHGRNGDPAGAVIWNWGYEKRVWVRPGVKIDEDDPEYIN